IVNTASLSALRVVREQGLYASTKFAVLGYTEVLRAELAGQGVGVSALCPGTVPTSIRVTGMPGAERDNAELGRSVEAMLGTVAPAYLSPVDADSVAALTIEAIKADDAYVITAPSAWVGVQERFDALQAAFATARERGPDLP